MIYAFCFLGEFGYELFNWQGVVRKFTSTLGPSDRVAALGRRAMHPWYEGASSFVDVSEVPEYRSSVACGYYAMSPNDLKVHSRANVRYDREVREALIRHALKELGASRDQVRFVFSSERTRLRGCTFGAPRILYGRLTSVGDIYERLNLGNNTFSRISPDLSVRPGLEKALGFDLGSEKYILVQSRARKTLQPSSATIPVLPLVGELHRHMRVILLGFDTGRTLDSTSEFAELRQAQSYRCGSFAEQACLVHFARHCVFMTEGDFGSHIYVPPFLGRDVVAVAPRDVYAIGTTPLEFWNRNVFRFGGQIRPLISEDLFATADSLRSAFDAAFAG
jgi:hypothetical protein